MMSSRGFNFLSNASLGAISLFSIRADAKMSALVRIRPHFEIETGFFFFKLLKTSCGFCAMVLFETVVVKRSESRLARTREGGVSARSMTAGFSVSTVLLRARSESGLSVPE